MHSAELQLEFTEVRAPVDGYVTHLDLRIGDQAAANRQALALVDVNSYWVYGYFKEDYAGRMQAGDKALVTLMSHPDTPLEGRVVSKGWGVWQEDGSIAQQLLPKISATYEWIRLAQRIPVRIEFDEVPEGIELIVGATASVLVMIGTAESGAPPLLRTRQPAPPGEAHGSHDGGHGTPSGLYPSLCETEHASH